MAINSYPDNSGGEVNFPDQLIDPVSKFRVSNPENLIDTDFEYGLQPTKWETVELINNTPSFFSKSGDTTIDGISSIITNAGTREIIVKTELDHGLAVGIPINVTGTKSITADGAYIINSIPDTKTFTYLCKDNQIDTNSILDLYSSIITGEFFQGSQLRISDSDGIVTDAEGTSTLTVTTNTTHGFGRNTPFYFLNLNSTVAQEFQAANTASKSFDASNSATAQTFDGSNSLSSVNIDWSNSATFGGTPSTISGTDQAADTITVTHQAGENFNNLPLGTPLYYAVSATGGYFNTNPRGVVFLKTINQLGTSTSTFQVSLIPDGDVIDLTSNLNGTFQIANQARTFAGNNINPLTQTVINAEVGTTFNFDGVNNGYVDSGLGGDPPPSNTLTTISYTGTTINASGSSNVDGYVGAMVLYSSTGTAATGLTTNTTYFITSFTNNSGGNYDFSVAALPGGTPISISGGTGTQTFSRIGISLDKDIVHVPNSNFAKDDMLEYIFPVDGRFGVVDPDQEKKFYFVDTAYDSHNYKLNETLSFKPVVATGGNFTTEVYENGRVYRVHTFTSTGTSNFVVSDEGADGQVQYLVVGGGGSGGTRHGGGGGAGGFVEGTATVTAQTYSVVVGAGGLGQVHSNGGLPGGNSSALGIVALGGGAGQGFPAAQPNGGSGGGSPDGSYTFGTATQPGSASGGFGNRGGSGTSNPWYGGGGGGAGGVGENVVANVRAGNGGPGRSSSINGTLTFYAGGGGGASWQGNPSNISGTGGIGGGGNGTINNATPAPAQANRGGGGGAHGGESTGFGGNGGSGIVILRYPTSPEPSGEFIIATGGQISVVNDGGIKYAVHSFTNTGTTNFVVSSISSNPSNNQAQYLIIGGGGAGAQRHSGGGGAGGYRAGSVAITNAQTYPVVVGAGAPAVAQTILPTVGFPVQGGNSSALGIIAQGGGAGGSGTGGSGGGANTGASVGLGTAGQGNNGGQGNPGPFAAQSSYTGGGGGGAGTTGFNATVATPSTGGNGGNGLSSSITGTPVTRAGGGGGGAASDGVRGGFGGTGGGGAGGSTGAGVSGLPNTGGGGGGGGFNNEFNFASGGGGSGIVIIRYPIGLA